MPEYETLHTISYRESTSFVHLMDRIADLKGMTRSEYMRQALRDRIAQDVAQTGDDYRDIMTENRIRRQKHD